MHVLYYINFGFFYKNNNIKVIFINNYFKIILKLTFK